MKNIAILFMFFFTLTSCKENELIIYSQDKESVYFYIRDDADDNVITKTLATETTDNISVEIPVKCSGLACEEDRTFKVSIVSELTTAEEETDYEVLEEEYTFPAGCYDAVLPLVIHKSGAAATGTVTLAVEVIESTDFKVGEKLRTQAVINYSTTIEMPDLWSSYYFGDWSTAKYLLFLEFASLTEFPDADEFERNNYLYTELIPRMMKAYYLENYPVYDENGNIITTW